MCREGKFSKTPKRVQPAVNFPILTAQLRRAVPCMPRTRCIIQNLTVDDTADRKHLQGGKLNASLACEYWRSNCQKGSGIHTAIRRGERAMSSKNTSIRFGCMGKCGIQAAGFEFRRKKPGVVVKRR